MAPGFSMSPQASEAAVTTAAAASPSGDKLRLRVYHGGIWVEDPKTNLWKYDGGESHNFSMPMNVTFQEFLLQVGKRWPTVGLRYADARDNPDPSELISLQTEDDYEEMKDEYRRAVDLGLQSKNIPRIRLYFVEDEMTPEMWEDYYAHVAPTHDDDTAHRASDVSNNSSSSFPHTPSDSSKPFRFEGGYETDAEVPPEEDGPNESFLPENPYREPCDPFVQRVCNTMSQLPTLQFFAATGTVPPGGSDSRGENRSQLWLVEQDEQSLQSDGLPAKEPFDSAAEAYGVPSLPSTISAFGDRHESSAGAVKLPTHISAFGDTTQDGMLQSSVPDDAFGVGSGGPHTQDGAMVNGSPVDDAILADIDVGASALGSVPPQPLWVTDPLHRVAKNEVRVTRKIGEGAFGEVSQADVPVFGSVAVKWLKRAKVQKHGESFWREAQMMANLNHPNLLRFYGVVTESKQDLTVVGIVTEYMPGGSLAQTLKRGQGPLPPKLRCELALNAVLGMEYLHHKRIVHFDLKPDNLLLLPGEHGSMTLKVADFGLSKHKWHDFVSSGTNLRGTLPYMAPELAHDKGVTEKADVWSMGIVMWEMVTRLQPYQDLDPTRIIAKLMDGSIANYLPVPSSCEPEWRHLIDWCLEVDAKKRPTFSDLANYLGRMRDMYERSEAAMLACSSAQRVAAHQQGLAHMAHYPV